MIPLAWLFSGCNSNIVPVAEVDSIAYQQTAITMSGENMEDNATARVITELQESMRLMCEEMKVMKTSGVTCAGNDPL